MHTLKIVPLVLVLSILPRPTQAGIDAPGGLTFDFGAPESSGCSDLNEVAGEQTDCTLSKTYFSSQASSFGEQGLLIWTSFELEGPDGLRQATLLLDLDPGQMRAWDVPLPPAAWSARYFETRNDVVLFEADWITGELGLFSLLPGEDDEGRVEGWFQLLLRDSQTTGPGCRMLLDGRFASQGDTPPSQASSTDNSYGDSSAGGCDSGSDSEDVVLVGCDAVASSDETYDDSGCGGYDDSDDSYDSTDSSSGCDGDGYDSYDSYDSTDSSSGCDGDAYDSTDSSDWDSDSSGDCAGDAEAATSILRPTHRRPTNQGDLLARILRFFPEICAGLFIALMKRHQRGQA